MTEDVQNIADAFREQFVETHPNVPAEHRAQMHVRAKTILQQSDLPLNRETIGTALVLAANLYATIGVLQGGGLNGDQVVAGLAHALVDFGDGMAAELAEQPLPPAERPFDPRYL